MTEFASLYELFEAIPDEAAAIAHFTAIRWRDGAFCPYCGSLRIYHFTDGRNHKCADCRQRFSIKVGTVFEDTKIGLRKWMAAIWLITSHRKGIASTQLARDIGVTQKTAWFMLHRLRHAARMRSFTRRLKGTVEVDETYVGGKESNKPKRKRLNKGRGPVGKTPVLGIVERDGEIRMVVLEDTKQVTIHPILHANITPGARLITDHSNIYRDLDAHFAHQQVNHAAGEFVKDDDVHTNSIEGVWAILKRQIGGIHHWVSPAHLSRYLDEVAWRYNRRLMGDGDRITALLSQTAGRLRYVELIAVSAAS